MTDFSSIVFPQNVPETGQANYVAQPVAPATAQSNIVGPLNPPAPETAQANRTQVMPNTQQTGQAVKNPDPFNANVPATGIANIVPFPTPLGVSPQFEPTTENWTYDYGVGGGT
jgi:hypothetical protein